MKPCWNELLVTPFSLNLEMKAGHARQWFRLLSALTYIEEIVLFKISVSHSRDLSCLWKIQNIKSIYYISHSTYTCENSWILCTNSGNINIIDYFQSPSTQSCKSTLKGKSVKIPPSININGMDTMKITGAILITLQIWVLNSHCLLASIQWNRILSRNTRDPLAYERLVWQKC
jgi:hypothetical protein